jgi:hypothetical protein
MNRVSCLRKVCWISTVLGFLHPPPPTLENDVAPSLEAQIFTWSSWHTFLLLILHIF